METEPGKGYKAAMLIQFFIEELRAEDLVAPCHKCGYPTVTPLMTEEGHIECFECGAEGEEENGED